MHRRSAALAALAAGALAADPARAAEAIFADAFEVAAFCAGAATVAIPSPDAAGKVDPGVADAAMMFAQHWIGRAAAARPDAGGPIGPVLETVNAQARAIREGFAAGAAPFYDLAQCDEAAPALLWPVVPASTALGLGQIPRSGAITLDRLADDREVEVFRSRSGRLRPAYAGLAVAETFADEVRILALRHAVGTMEGAPAAYLGLGLGRLLGARALGAPVLNQENALAALTAAARASAAGDERWAQAQSALCLGHLTRIAGDRADNLERAIAACRAALPALDRDETRGAWAGTQQYLAGALFDRVRGRRAANIEAAIAADRAGLAARSRESDPGGWAAAQSNLGVHLSGRRAGDAQDNIEQALAAFEAAATVITPEAAPDAALVLQNNLAQVLARRQRGGLAANQDAAIALLDRMLASPGATGSIRGTALYNLAETWRTRRNGERRDNLERAARLYRSALLEEGVNSRAAIPRARALGATLIALGRFEEARDALKIATRATERQIGLGLDEAELREVLSEAADVHGLAAYALAKAGDAAAALETLSAGKARLLFAALAFDDLALSAAERAELAALRGELQQGESALEAAVLGEGSGAMADVATVDRLEAARERVLALYDKGSRAALVQPRAADAVVDGALIAPVVTEFGTTVLVATPGGAVRAFDVPELARAALDPLVERVGRARRSDPLAPPEDADLAALQGELGATLGRAVRSALADSGIAPGATVTVLPDGPSAILPLALARDPASGRALIEDYGLRFVPSLAALRASRRRAAEEPRESLALLLPPADAGLDFALVEGKLVESEFAAGRREAWRDADKAALLAGMGTQSYWHFATHGWFDWDDPRASGVVIGENDAMLTLGDLLEARRRLGAPRLVVLSACSTGISEVGRNPEEFSGLPSGFLFAGAAAVLASLWPVDDLSTALLMSRFYDLHLAADRPPATALREAQLWLKGATTAELRDYVLDKGRSGALDPAQAETFADDLGALGGSGPPFAAPRHWGAFVVYGT